LEEKMRLMVLLLFVAVGYAQSVQRRPTHVRRIGHITLHGAVERVFPLFGPLDEAKWAPGWEPSIKYGGNAESGTVFTTESSTHPAIWIVTRYDAQSHDMQYTTVFPEDRVVQLDIACHSGNASETLCNVAYAITTLSDLARPSIERYTQQRHEERIAHWQMAINHYLQTGTRIAPHE
jgi:hypothetical protein